MDDFGRPEKKKSGLTENQKGWLTFAAIGVIGFFGAFYLLFMGDEQQHVATDLAKEIKALEGEGYGNKVNKFVSNSFTDFGVQDESAKTQLQEMLQSMQYKADFSPIKEFVDGAYGGVKIDTADINSKVSQDRYKDLVIKKTVSEPNKYYFNTDFESRQLTGEPSGNAWLFTSYTGFDGFVEFENENKDSLKAMDMTAEKASFKDGSGTVEYASLKNMVANFMQNESDAESDFEAKFAVEEIAFGQMLKLLVGEIQPIAVDFQIDYKGDSAQKLARIIEQTPDVIGYLDKGVAEAAKQASAAEKYSGHLKLDNLSVTTGDMGFVNDIDLEFSGFPYQPVPVGEMNFRIKSYKKLIEYVGKFMPVPQAELEATMAEVKQYYVEDGDDLVLKMSLDGSRIVKLGNGSEINLAEYFKRPAPAEYEIPEQDLEQYRSDFETPVESDSRPIELPQVEQKPL